MSRKSCLDTILRVSLVESWRLGCVACCSRRFPDDVHLPGRRSVTPTAQSFGGSLANALRSSSRAPTGRMSTSRASGQSVLCVHSCSTWRCDWHFTCACLQLGRVHTSLKAELSVQVFSPTGEAPLAASPLTSPGQRASVSASPRLLQQPTGPGAHPPTMHEGACQARE
jgi:hypothetical protein